VPHPGNPQSLNRYSDCLNNPLRYIDPTGHGGEEADAPLTEGDIVWMSEGGWQINTGGRLLSSSDPRQRTLPSLKDVLSNIVNSGIKIEDEFYKLRNKISSFINNGDVIQTEEELIQLPLLPPMTFSEFLEYFGPILNYGMVAPGAMGGDAARWSYTLSKAALANKLNHIFADEGHNLAPLLSKFNGNQVKAFKALEISTQEFVSANNISGQFKDILVNVDGVGVTVRGNVINGQARIGTFFIP
jgi:hypothetical protein